MNPKNLEITPDFNCCYNQTKRKAHSAAIDYFEKLGLDSLQKEEKIIELHRQLELLLKESEALNRQEYVDNAYDSEFLFTNFTNHMAMLNKDEQQKLEQAIMISRKKYWLQYLIVETQVMTDIQELEATELEVQRNKQCLTKEQKERMKYLLAELDMIRSNYQHLSQNKPQLSSTNQKRSFEYRKPENDLFPFIKRLNEEIGFLMPRTSVERFIQIITSKDLDSVSEKIYLGCKTNEFKYVLTYLSAFFDSLTFTNIGRSALFMSNQGTLITATNLTSANYEKMNTRQAIDRIFR